MTGRLKILHPELDLTMKRLGWMRTFLIILLCGIQLRHLYLIIQEITTDSGLSSRPVNSKTAAVGLIVIWFFSLVPRARKKNLLPVLIFAITSSLMVLIPWIPVDSCMTLVILSLVLLSLNRSMLFSLIGTCIAALISFSLMVLMKRTFSYYFLGSVFVCLILFSWYFHDILIRWNESLTLFSQARWAASEYAKVNNRLQDSMTTTEMDIRDQERMRIAREIHDILGYGITGSLVQITMAKELVKIDVDAAITTLGKIEDCLRIALKDVRGEVNKLKCQTVAFGNWREQWDSLCNNFAWSTGVQVHTNISTELIGVDEKIGENVYRIIQEALTNAYRHGSSSLIDVSMKYKKELRQILLRISDNGYGCDKIRMGNGLSGIKERVKELSGETAWQTESNAGFDIGVSIPWEKRPSVAEN